MAGGVILSLIIMILLFGAAKKRAGKNEQKNRELAGEIETARKANKLRDAHRHDSGDDVIDGL